MSVLDISDRQADLSEADLHQFDGFLIKCYGVSGNISFTARNVMLAHGSGKPYGLYLADQTLTFDLSMQALRYLDRRIGLKIGEFSLYQDWFEWLVQPSHGGMTPEHAALHCKVGLQLFHDQGIKLGGYGSELNAWRYYAGYGLHFDSRWVANYNDIPKIPFDLHQFAAIQSQGDLSVTARGLTVAEVFNQTKGGISDVTPEEVNSQIATATATDSVASTEVYALRWQGWFDHSQAVKAGVQNPEPRKPSEPHYMDGWNLV